MLLESLISKAGGGGRRVNIACLYGNSVKSRTGKKDEYLNTGKRRMTKTRVDLETIGDHVKMWKKHIGKSTK